MNIAVAQINTTVGDFSGNVAKILERLVWAEGAGADLVVFPELAVCGYPPRDLLEVPSFIANNLEALDRIARRTQKTAVAVGFVSVNHDSKGRGLFNSAGLCYAGRLQFTQHKTLLPEYDVFDEARHFEPAPSHDVHTFRGRRLGLSLCEDMWACHTFSGRRLYRVDPIARLAAKGAEFILNLSASPFHLGKEEERKAIVAAAAKRVQRPVVYCNLVGGNDELIFDGQSLVVDAAGEVIVQAKSFVEESFLVDLVLNQPHSGGEGETPTALPLEGATRAPEIEALRQALCLGIGDYFAKCGFSRAIVGLSGGIDSAVVAALAVQALGANRVSGILMPSPFTQQQSVDDALTLARHLGIHTETHPIDSIYDRFRQELGLTGKKDVTLAEENLQARIRGTILMTRSNQTGALLLSTGNKSELAVGYCTLYGDMAGGLAVIADIPKTMVYELAHHFNRERTVIPTSIIERAPSAELKPDQTDQDILPDYAVLDEILRYAIEDRWSVDAIVAAGFARSMVEDVVRRVDRNEYKRRQAAPGLKVTSKAFGTGRRFPIAWRRSKES